MFVFLLFFAVEGRGGEEGGVMLGSLCLPCENILNVRSRAGVHADIAVFSHGQENQINYLNYIFKI